MILIKILKDPEWSRTPLRQIARDVGCSESWVRQTRDKLSNDGLRSTAQRADHITVKTSDGKEYERPSFRNDRPKQAEKILTGIIDKLSEIDVTKAARKEISAAIKHIESAKTLI